MFSLRRSWWLAIFFISSTLVLSSCQSRQETSEYRKAQRAIKRGEPRKAIQYFSRELKKTLNLNWL